MRRMALGASVLLFTCAWGCSKGEIPAGHGDAAGAPVGPLEASSAPGRPTESAAPAPRAWSGTYRTKAGALYVPEDWKVRWRSEDPPSGAAGIGEGPLTLSIDPSGGSVHGGLEGPLGPAIIDGLFADGGVSATITRRDPRDHGFAGVLAGKASGTAIEGTLNLSPATGGAVRLGTFSVAPSDADSGS